MSAETSGRNRTLRLGQSLVVVLAAFLAAAALVPPLSTWLVAAGLVVDGGTGWHLARTVLQFGTFAVPVFTFLAVAEDWELLGLAAPTRRELLLGLGGVAVLLVGQVGFVVGFEYLGIGTGENRAITGDYAPLYYLAMVPLSILVVGPVEELLFRGTVQGLLRRAWGPWPAIALATAVFGLVHYAGVSGTGTERLAYMFIAAILGGVLGYLYEVTGSVVVPALVHGTYNAVIFGVQYAQATGLL